MGFEEADDSYNSLSEASDGCIYYVLSTLRYDIGAQFYRYNPSTGENKLIADLSEALGESNCISQGKSHVEFTEWQGKLYFATHLDYCELYDGWDRLPTVPPQEGWGLYPGGHFLSYDMQSGEFEDLAIAPGGEGILTMAMDPVRGHIFGLTWPSGLFVDYDLNSGGLRNLGQISRAGETCFGTQDFRIICRSMFIDPRDGRVFWSTADGEIFGYDPAEGEPRLVEGASLRLGLLGEYDPSDSETMAYNWRKIAWCPALGKAVGVHGHSSYLFTFDPQAPELRFVDRIASEPYRSSGEFNPSQFGYLSFRVTPEGFVYYLTAAPLEEGECFHMVTYDLASGEYRDNGAIRFADGSYPTGINSIALGSDGTLYALARHGERKGLIKISY